MVLLKHGNFEFKNIISSNYEIQEDIPDEVSKATMGDGSIRKNYRPMPKTKIKITFGQMDNETFSEYINHFGKYEDYYTYYSYKYKKYLTKLFEVTTPPTAKVIEAIDDGRLDEFEVDLSQVGGEATS